MTRIEINNKVVGSLVDNVFRKRVRGSKHLYKKLDAWGISAGIIYELSWDNAEIRILDEETGTVYVTDAQTYQLHGDVEQNPGFEKQVFLSRSYFKKHQYEKAPIA